jgi:hypothetical protein
MAASKQVYRTRRLHPMFKGIRPLVISAVHFMYAVDALVYLPMGWEFFDK